MNEELKAQLQDMVLDNHWTGIYVAKPSLEAIEQLERQLAERDAEIAKYRDAPVVWIHSGHLHQALNQPFLCRVLPEQCEGYKQLIVKPGE